MIEYALTDTIAGTCTEGNEGVGMSSSALIDMESIRIESVRIGEELLVSMVRH